MSLSLSPRLEAEVTTRAEKAGLSVEEFMNRLLYLVPDQEAPLRSPAEPQSLAAEEDIDPIARADALIRKWQAQDNTPQSPPTPNDSSMTPTQALFKQWRVEDAQLTEEEIQERLALWHEVEQAILKAERGC